MEQKQINSLEMVRKAIMMAAKKIVDDEISKVETQITSNTMTLILNFLNTKAKSYTISEPEVEFKMKTIMIRTLRKKSFSNSISSKLFSGAGGLSLPVNYFLTDSIFEYNEIYEYFKDMLDLNIVSDLIYKQLLIEVKKIDFIAANIEFETRVLAKIKHKIMSMLNIKGIQITIKLAWEIVKDVFIDYITNKFKKKNNQIHSETKGVLYWDALLIFLEVFDVDLHPCYYLRRNELW